MRWEWRVDAGAGWTGIRAVRKDDVRAAMGLSGPFPQDAEGIDGVAGGRSASSIASAMLERGGVDS